MRKSSENGCCKYGTSNTAIIETYSVSCVWMFLCVVSFFFFWTIAFIEHNTRPLRPGIVIPAMRKAAEWRYFNNLTFPAEESEYAGIYYEWCDEKERRLMPLPVAGNPGRVGLCCENSVLAPLITPPIAP